MKLTKEKIEIVEKNIKSNKVAVYVLLSMFVGLYIVSSFCPIFLNTQVIMASFMITTTVSVTMGVIYMDRLTLRLMK